MSDMAVTRVELPSGGYVVLKDPRHVTIRGRRPITAVMAKLSDLGVEGIDEILCAGGAALIAQWSFEEPITADTIADLISVEDADVLLRKIMPLVAKLTPNLSPDGVDDEESPTPA